MHASVPLTTQTIEPSKLRKAAKIAGVTALTVAGAGLAIAATDASLADVYTQTTTVTNSAAKIAALVGLIIAIITSAMSGRWGLAAGFVAGAVGVAKIGGFIDSIFGVII